MQRALSILPVCFVALGCQVHPPKTSPAPPAPPPAPSQPAPQEGPLTSNKLELGLAAEASGVAIGPKGPVVILDNSRGALFGAPSQPSPQALTPHKDGYEGLTFDGTHFHAVVEALKTKDGPRAQIDTYDPSWRLLHSRPVDLQLPTRNKGIEGIAHEQTGGALHLFLLCEAPGCDPKEDSGKGRIHVVRLEGDTWRPVDRIKLPKSLAFRDFSGLDIVGDRIAVTSQETRALWRGRLARKTRPDGTTDWSVEGDGEVTELGDLCNLEGVALDGEGAAWLVTDRKKSSQPEGCAALDQSIHRLTTP